jgi:hypothetical protein
MADPFSFVAGAVGIADVTIRVITYLRDVKAATDTIDADIDGLVNEILSLKQVHGHLDEEYQKQTGKRGLSAEETVLWAQTKRTLENGQTLVHQQLSLDSKATSGVHADDRRRMKYRWIRRGRFGGPVCTSELRRKLVGCKS